MAIEIFTGSRKPDNFISGKIKDFILPGENDYQVLHASENKFVLLISNFWAHTHMDLGYMGWYSPLGAL